MNATKDLDLELTAGPSRTLVRINEDKVRLGFWPKVRRAMGLVPFMDDALAAYYCAMDPRTPARVRAILMGALAYFVMPVDIIPDFIAGLGFTDDATVIATAIGIVSGHIKPRHKQAARIFLRKPAVILED